MTAPSQPAGGPVELARRLKALRKDRSIPQRTVAYRSEVAGAYVVTPAGEIRFRQLRLGEKTADGAIEVLAGLSAGERVALDPVAALSAMKQAALK